MNKIRFSIVTKKRNHGMLGVYIRSEQYGRTMDFNTDVHIFKDEWDDENGLVISNPNSNRLNMLIRKTLYELEQSELEYQGDFNLFKLRDIWDSHIGNHDFYNMMSKQIESRCLRESTKEIHRRVLRLMIAYKEECNVSDLTEDYVKGFLKYLQETKHSFTTQAMHAHVLRCYYNIARKLYGNKVPSDSFDFYHETQKQQTRFTLQPLDEEDIRRIENYVAKPDTKSRQVFVLEQFLFMSYTGCRISDFESLTKKNFTVENGTMWLTYTSVKTDTFVRLPISTVFDSRAEQLYHKYYDVLDKFFYVPNHISFNAKLKTACKNAGITKRVTAHVARHTFASRLVNRDVPVSTIQQVIGHRCLKTTMVYAKTSEQTLIRHLS